MSTLLRRPGVWIALAIAGLVAVGLAVRARGPRVRVVAAARKDLEQHVVASGRVWVPTRVQVAPRVPGLVVAVAVTEGQHVKAGELLVQLDDAEARTAVAQAKAAVDQASARALQLRRVGAIVANESLRQAETNLTLAETELARVQKLAASGAVAASELDTARRAAELARAQRVAAEAQQISSAPLGADSRVALTQLVQAEAELAGANVRLAQTRITALQDATVLSRSVEPGDVVSTSRTILVLAADTDTELVFQPDERNLAFLALGQKARASADAYPATVFDAEVGYIAPAIDPARGSVEVRLRVPAPPRFLKPDMTVSVDLTVAARPGALVVPSEAVHGAATDRPWVLVVEGGRASKKDVTLGLHGDGKSEIAAGLADGALVVLPEGLRLSPGDRVRAEQD